MSVPRVLMLLLPLLAGASCGSAHPDAVRSQEEIEPEPALAEAQTASGELLVQALDLTRTTGGTLEVRLAFSNISGSDRIAFEETFAGAAEDAGTIAGVYLLDRVTRKKYFVIRDADGRPQCSTGLEPLGPGERRVLWARFPAPPEDVDRVSIYVPEVEPFEDVPLTAGAAPPRR
jgi:hypothetical protein